MVQGLRRWSYLLRAPPLPMLGYTLCYCCIPELFGMRKSLISH